MKILYLSLALLLPQFCFAATPKLVVVLVIDQFRADNLTRFENDFLPVEKPGKLGGFRYLMQKGAYYPFAQYDILQPMTGPGHATILSGSYPYLNGIATNEWYNREKNHSEYCVIDEDSPSIGGGHGYSPKNFIGTTVGDELKNAGLSSKVVSIALKDRAAILMGGRRADLALWMDQKSFRWTTSTYYRKDSSLPAFVTKLNAELAKAKGTKFLWQKKQNTLPGYPKISPEGTYADALGASFPHQIERGTISELASPAGLTLTVDAASAALDEFQLGKHKNPDLLAVSFSSHDYVGHAFGPNSDENESMVQAEDMEISRLLNIIQKKVSGNMKDVVLVLTADHGIVPPAAWLQQNHVVAEAIDTNALLRKVDVQLDHKFGHSKESWIAFSDDFGYWLNPKVLKSKDIELDAAASEVKKVLIDSGYFSYVITEEDYRTNHLPPGMHERRIKKTYFPQRSGDIVGIVKPFHYGRDNTVNHLADYSYDETVPLIIAGSEVKAGRYPEKAEVVDIAPTLSYLLGVLPPVLSEGRVLSEAIKH